MFVFVCRRPVQSRAAAQHDDGDRIVDFSFSFETKPALGGLSYFNSESSTLKRRIV